MKGSRVRVLVAEDSLTVRTRLCEILEADEGVEIVGTAEDGKTAIELCERLRPDVVTMDMIMPVMSGLAATEYIMAHCPTPILVVSASANRGELFKTYDALAAGAVDVLDKPGTRDRGDQWEAQFVATVKLVSRIKVITHPRARLPRGAVAAGRPGASSFPAARTGTLAAGALGASTGGPGALVTVLKDLPAPLPWPVFLVMHIGEPFGSAFAEWLDAQTPHRVRYAGDGARVPPAEVIMAPPDRHLVVRGGRLWLTADSLRHSCRPSVDVLFESLATEYGAGVWAALLTGMGRDGASGLLKIREAGGLTIAQDEASSVVYGMPREAVLLGAAQRVLPLHEIGPALAAVATGAAG
ncbi:MAG TPA: chemotaxis-specific protein-glutamate methyltransferase CheB [Vicinamibacteria bacterium]|nr:chemotaxis-specific protein-glutamate methyltransferase CheB [Vicinamibacteria bacterium]